MDRRERQDNPEEAMRIALGAAQSGIWTALPGIIQSFDPQAMTCTVQPSISLQQRGSDGTMSPINLPVLLDCPVIFPSGGGCTLTFPIKPGDECLMHFAARCIDSWWQQGGVQGQVRMRMHDLSDGFVFVGPRSQPRVLSPSVSTSTVQLRSDDGQAFVEIDPNSHLVHTKTSGDIEAEATGHIYATAQGDIKAQAQGSISLIAQGAINIQSAVQINLIAPAVNLTGYPGSVTTLSGGTINSTNMTWNYTTNTVKYVGGTFTYNGKDMTNTHFHVNSGGTGNGGQVG